MTPSEGNSAEISFDEDGDEFQESTQGSEDLQEEDEDRLEDGLSASSASEKNQRFEEAEDRVGEKRRPSNSETTVDPPHDEGEFDPSVEALRDRRKRVEQDVTNITQQYETYVYGASGGSVEELSNRHFNAYGERQLRRLLQEAFCDESELEDVAAILRRHRVAILVGEPDVGKGTLALLAAARLRESDSSNRATGPEVLDTSPLDPRVRAPLAKLLRDKGKKLGCGLFLFRDFLSTSHPDLQCLIQELEKPFLGVLTDMLAQAGSYLLFTSDVALIQDHQLRLETLGVLHVTVGPSPEVVRQVLESKVADLAALRRADETIRSAVREIVEKQGGRIVEQLGTPPRVSRFADRFLLAVAAGEISLERALEEVDDLGLWLLQELAEDTETFAFALALVLTQNRPPHSGTPWLMAHGLAQLIARRIRGIKGERRGAGTALSDERRLETLRARVQRQPFPSVDLLRFQDESYPDRLWEILLGPGRELMSHLLPLLRRLVDGEEDVPLHLRFLAARALGRGGVLDPWSVVLPLFRKWARSDYWGHHVALGHLLQATLGVDLPVTLRQAYLQHLRAVVVSARGTEAFGPAVALKGLGEVDVALALEGLVLLASSNLPSGGLILDPSRREGLRVLEELLRLAVEEVRRRGGTPKPLDWELRSFLTQELLGGRESAIKGLAAVQFGLVGLCFAHDPVTVLQRFSDALETSKVKGIHLVYPLLVLRKDGILDVLERNPVSSLVDGSLGAGEESACSHFLVATRDRTEGPLVLASLVADWYRKSGAFPGTFARALKKRLSNLVKSWAKQAATQGEIRPTVVRFLAALLHSDDVELKEDVFRLLRQDRAFASAESPLGKLALEALTARKESAA